MNGRRKVVVIGAGAREHALVRALVRGAAQGEPREVVAIPGNAGIAREVRCVPSAQTARALCAAALAERPDLVVVGPEAPLAEGLADLLAESEVPCFGPRAAAARIEASKAFAKEVMHAAFVPTAEGEVFDDPDRARARARERGACVVKLDGLAAGKGVIVCDDGAQAAAAVDALFQPGARLLIEERLEGKELSVIGLCDGETVLALPPARDHKRLRDGDEGPNTGGMGAVSPPRDATDKLVADTVRTVLEPTARELQRRGTPFRGALYAGLMLTPRGVRVLEFNCRLGDPEAQAILLRLRTDPLPLLLATAMGRLAGQLPVYDARTAVAVVIAAAGYPATPRAGDEIRGLRALAEGEPGGEGDDLWVLHAGTRAEGDRIMTAGGRVLTVAALGKGPAQARARAYGAAARIQIDGAQLRGDIAAAEV
ncbi:MAG TPA: phosphoribosylamine--glycine ligase [Myxococcales bacterium]|nr:phosphoribosylamine--glycine ligase [Myxococcales bacterium]